MGRVPWGPMLYINKRTNLKLMDSRGGAGACDPAEATDVVEAAGCLGDVGEVDDVGDN